MVGGNTLSRPLYILDDENNPSRSNTSTVFPKTTIDQVFDPETANNDTLRTILENMKLDILSGGTGVIRFPVTTVNGKIGDVVVTAADLHLENVDNTADSEKPLSDRQRASVNEMIASYEFTIDNSGLLEHLANTNNPHGITIDHLNQNDELKSFVNNLINAHEIDPESHESIRNQIADMEDTVEEATELNRQRIETAVGRLDNHTNDENAHAQLLVLREDVSNKVAQVRETDLTHYPSTLALKLYVEDQLDGFADNNRGHWISDIGVVNTADELPTPNIARIKQIWYVRYGQNGKEEMHVCRYINGEYVWIRYELGAYTRFNDQHFSHENGVMSINMEDLSYSLLSDPAFAATLSSSLDTMLPSKLEGYATQEDIRPLISKITIVPGRDDGTIQYYINDDLSTVSDIVRITGLQRLAFLEFVNGEHIEQEAIDEEHIKNRAIKNRHIDDKQVTARNLSTSFECILGNVNDSLGRTTEEIPLRYLAQLLAPYLAAELQVETTSGETVEEIMRRLIQESLIDYNLAPSGTGAEQGEVDVVRPWMAGGYVGIDSNEPLPEITRTEEGDLYMRTNGTDVSNYLEHSHFEVDPNDGVTYFVHDDDEDNTVID